MYSRISFRELRTWYSFAESWSYSLPHQSWCSNLFGDHIQWKKERKRLLCSEIHDRWHYYGILISWNAGRIHGAVALKISKACLNGHLQNTFTEQWHHKFHVISKGDRVNGLPKSLQIAISGLAVSSVITSEDDCVNRP